MEAAQAQESPGFSKGQHVCGEVVRPMLSDRHSRSHLADPNTLRRAALWAMEPPSALG